MIKYFFFITFYLLSFFSFSQDKGKTDNAQSLSIELYNSGATALKNNAYAKADSLFTLSINSGYKTKDSYYGRALARKNLGNTCGYCVDLACAASSGSKEANTAFWKKCQAANIALTCIKDIRVAVKDTQALIMEYDSVKNITRISILYLNTGGAFSCFKDGINRQDTLYAGVATFERPKFLNGDMDIFRFLQQRTQYPEIEKRNGIQGKVFVSFIIDVDGSLKNIEIYKGVKGGRGLDQESMRVVSLMPKWTPAKFNGEPVKCNFILPMVFRLQ